MGRILIVDPALIDRKRMANVLEAAGHQVVEKLSPAEVLAAAAMGAKERVDLIVTELNAGSGPDLSFLKWLKESSAWRTVPVMVVTSPLPREQLIQLVASGAEMVVTKPFAPEVLLRRVTELLAEHGAGVPGRGSRDDLTEQLAREVKRAERFSTSVSLLVLRLSHPVDSWVWSRLTSAMGRALRGSDLVAQVGRSAVAVLLPDAAGPGAEAVAERLGAQFAQGRPNGPRIVGVGIAVYPEDGENAADLISLALDRASSGGASPTS